LPHSEAPAVDFSSQAMDNEIDTAIKEEKTIADSAPTTYEVANPEPVTTELAPSQAPTTSEVTHTE